LENPPGGFFLLWNLFLAILRGAIRFLFLFSVCMGWSLTLWGMAAGIFLSLLSFGAVIYSIDPESAGWTGWTLFLMTLFVLLTGGISFLSLLVRALLLGRDRTLFSLGRSFREGTLGALWVLGCIALFLRGWLVWWDALFLFLCLFLVEVYFLRKFRMN